jgi:hypothetical protein
VVSVELKQDFQGDFGGTARIQNASQTQSLIAVFKLTFTQDGQVVGAAEVSAQSVSPQQTVTVDLLSQAHYNGAPVSYTFQVDTEY